MQSNLGNAEISRDCERNGKFPDRIFTRRISSEVLEVNFKLLLPFFVTSTPYTISLLVLFTLLFRLS